MLGACFMKNAFIRARIEADLKEEAEYLLHELGLSTTDAITLFYKQVIAKKGLPFAVKIPNQVTKKAILQSKIRTSQKTFENVEELLSVSCL